MTDHGERQALTAELDALEAAPHAGGLGDMLRAALVERIEHRLDALAVDETQAHEDDRKGDNDG